MKKQTELRTLDRGRTTILEIAGDVDRQGATQLEGRVADLLGQGRVHLALDFGGVEKVDGAGFRVLLRLVQQLSGLAGNLVLCSLREEVRETFDIAGFSDLFAIVGHRDEALAYLDQERAIGAKIASLASDLLIREKTGQINFDHLLDDRGGKELDRLAELAARLIDAPGR